MNNQAVLLRSLCAWRDDENKLFTWLSLGHIWSLQFALTYQPHGGSSAGLSIKAVEKFTLKKALWWRDVALPKQREMEADAIKKARAGGK